MNLIQTNATLERYENYSHMRHLASHLSEKFNFITFIPANCMTKITIDGAATNTSKPAQGPTHKNTEGIQ